MVTPIGLAIDERDDLYVLESHTHTPPKDYPGPKYDRILKGVDADGDGLPESWTIFADSITAGMNLAFGPGQTLYLVEKNRVSAFRDLDGDGASDERHVLMRMVAPEYVYDHAGLLGVAVGPDGWIYVSRGNTGGQAWTVAGSDGARLHGYGDGGNVMRCRPDGSRLEEVATGFWNPFDLTFNLEGRLMLVDNDPDSRGPNRLLEVVPGGDYGYASLYGGSGIHPFLAWNGELPGTLPYAAALGEAPSGLIDAGLTHFPGDYVKNILVTVWEENTLVRIPLRDTGSTVRGEAEVILRGDSLFHPVALAANSRGDLYLTDWVVRQYPNHGFGRIWRLRAAADEAVAPLAAKPEDPKRKGSIFSAWEKGLQTEDELVKVLSGRDQFRKSAARKVLREKYSRQQWLGLLQHDQPAVRLQALVAAIPSDLEVPEEELGQLLEDPDPDIHEMALIYIARHGRKELEGDVREMLFAGKVPAELFETFLATLRHLQPAFLEAYREEKEPKSASLPRKLPEGYLLSLIRDANLDPEIRAQAVAFLDEPMAHRKELTELLSASPPAMQGALLHVLRYSPVPETGGAMVSVALDEWAPATLRAQAVLALAGQPEPRCKELLPLLSNPEEGLRETTLRYLCACADDPVIRQRVEARFSDDPETLAIWQLCAGERDRVDQPATPADWRSVVNRSGDPAKGALVFQSPKAQCQTCHRVGLWGGIFGPALTHVGSSKTPRQLMDAILDPSLEISPEWQGWYITDAEGHTHTGRQIDIGFSDAEIMLPSGEFKTYDDPLDYGMLPRSLMPEGLQRGLTPGEFNDLIAYLVSLK